MGLELLVSPGAGAGSHSQPWRVAQNHYPQYPSNLQHPSLLELGCHRVGLTQGQGDRWGRVAVPCVDTSKKRVRPEF